MKPITVEPEIPRDYVTRSAADKGRWIWDYVISAGRYIPSELPPLRMPFQQSPRNEISIVVKTSELEKVLTRTDDIMEPGRPKVIHALGAAALIRLVPSDTSPFTGLIGPPPNGGALGVIRMSLVATTSKNRSYTPGFGLKFLIDGKASADLLAMNHTIGQGRDFNLFSNTMTNDLTDEHRELHIEQKAMDRLFQRVSHKPRRLTSSHLSSQRAGGSTVASPITPRRLIFHPTPAASDHFKGKAGIDFRRVLDQIDEGTPLYEVTGLTTDGEQPVGILELTSRFISSAGAERLFFRHVQDPEDLKL